MAIGVTHLTNDKNVDGVGSASTAAITPTAQSLVLLFIAVDVASANVTPGNAAGLTWVNIFDANVWNFYDANFHCGLWRAMASSPSTASIPLSFAVGANIGWELLELTGVQTGGTHGSGAIVQLGTPELVIPPGVTITLAATAPTSAVVGFIVAHDLSVAVGPGAGFTTVASGTSAFPSIAWLSQWITGVSKTLCDFTMDTGGGRAFALEVAAAAPPGLLGAGAGPSIYRLARRKWSY